MNVPIISCIPRSYGRTVVNKTIVYSDTVLPLKDTGSNLKVTSISKVSKFSLETCLKCIFESNPDVIFNTVQYSPANKEVYFYTNKEISVKAWEDKNTHFYEPLKSVDQIMAEINKIFSSTPCMDNNLISLYDIGMLLKRKQAEYERFKEDSDDKLESLLKSAISDNIGFCLYDFDYDKNILSFSFSRRWTDPIDESKHFECTKKDGDLFIIKADSCLYADEIWCSISNLLSKVYDDFLKFKEFHTEYNYHISSKNCNFVISISEYGTGIKAIDDFSIDLPSYTKDYNIKCNSSVVMGRLKNNEDSLFQKIFVKIEDCPEWMCKELYDIRTSQLNIKNKKGFFKRIFSIFKFNK